VEFFGATLKKLNRSGMSLALNVPNAYDSVYLASDPKAIRTRHEQLDLQYE